MKNMKHKQSGFVAIIAAAILMIIMTLITIGFTQVMQREQRQALDRHLSSQAFYAAETAINDAYRYVLSKQEANQIVSEKTTCDVSGAEWNNGLISSGDTNVSYSCLLIDPTPTALEFNNSITESQSKIFPIQPKSGAKIQSITFQWNGTDGTNEIKNIAEDCTPPADGSIRDLPSTRLSAVPLLRIDLINIPADGADNITRDKLENGSAHFFLYPQNNCGGTTVSFANLIPPPERDTGRIVDVNCDPTANYSCEITINGIAGQNSNRMYARVRSIYGNANLRVTATDNSPSQFKFVGAQTVVDATGKANDVVRRVKAYLSTTGTYPTPEYVLQATQGICKDLEIAPPNNVTYSCY